MLLHFLVKLKIQTFCRYSADMEGITTTTTTVLWPFVRDYPGEPVPEETLTHPLS